MKHFTTAVIAAFAAASLLVSCETLDSYAEHQADSEGLENVGGGETCSIKICTAIEGSTKATGVAGDQTDENKCNRFQAIIFKGNNLVDYAEDTKNGYVSLKTIAGQRDIVVVLNAPSLKSKIDAGTIASKSSLLAQISKLEESGFANMLMVGDTTVTISGNMTLAVNVRHLAARIHLKKITRNFTAASMQKQTMTLKAIYLVNAAGSVSYGGTTDYSTITWYNRNKVVAADTAKLGQMIVDRMSKTIANGSAYTAGHYFYAYPNDSAKSNVKTLLVLETEIQGSTFYYPVEMPALESNKSYEINNIKLASTGSDDPSKPIEWDQVEIQYSVKPWTEFGYAEVEV